MDEVKEVVMEAEIVMEAEELDMDVKEEEEIGTKLVIIVSYIHLPHSFEHKN